jgi:hypothetical protein
VPTNGEKEARTRRILYIAAAAGIAGVLIAIALLAFGRGGETADAAGVQSAMETAGCTLTTVEALPGNHSVASPEGRSARWNTFPPTSGPHHVDSAIFGKYETPVNQAQLVHNLEHGGIFIQYGSDVPEETVAELSSFYDENKNGTILAPLSELGEKIAVGAWVVTGDESPDAEAGFGYLAECAAFDEAAFAAFFDEFQFKGPERFSSEMLAPGR